MFNAVLWPEYVSSPKFLNWDLISNVIESGSEAFARWLEFVLVNRISAFMKEDRHSVVYKSPCLWYLVLSAWTDYDYMQSDSKKKYLKI
jgi:hypothetical protein